MKTKIFLLLLAVFTISSNAQTQVVTGVNIGTALDYDGSHLYISELFGNKISRIDLNVGASSYEVVTNISRPEGVAVNGTEVYTAGISLGAALGADISGSLPAMSNTMAVGGDIRTVVFDATHGLYLIKTDGSSNTKIYSISGITQTFIVDVGVGDVRAGTIKGSEMYLSSRGGGSIYKFDLNNVATPTLVKSGLNQPYEIDIANNHLYFASEGGILGKFDLANTAAAPTIFVNNTLGDLAGIEVIGEDVYFTSWANSAVYKINDPALTPPCTIINIPDTNFKNYLVGNSAINTNGDTEIQCSEATAFTGSINVNNGGVAVITDLTGIEAFTSLTELLCANNQLTSLNLSTNTALTTLACNNNQLTSIDISNSTALAELRCDTNQLIGIDISNNTSLTSLICFSNSLTGLDVSANTTLTTLDCSYNSLTSIDVSANTVLTTLTCRTNQLTSLNVSANTALTFLNCFDTQLTSLDVSANTALTTLFCGNNSLLTSLNVANGTNANIVNFNTTNNPNLTCIQVDDVTYSTANWTNIDSASSFSTNCSTLSSSVSYVNHTATGNNDGSSWANAYTHLENALVAAADGSEIWVATGIYLPTTTSSQTISFSINNADLKIYGGFAGTEIQLSDRVLGTNETVLSGDLDRNDIFVNDHFSNNYYHGTKTDNSHTIINITALGSNLLLDGLTISNAHNTTSEDGAIIKEKTVAQLTLKNCTIKNNIAKGSSGIKAEFDLNNTSGTRGTLIIENSIFKNNMSLYASGIYSYARANTTIDIRVENTLFDNNISGNLSTSLRGHSGAASWFRAIGTNADVDLKLINNTYVNHIDDSDKNGIDDSSRATVVINKTAGVLNAEVVNCIFWNNYRPTSLSNIASRSITNTYQDAAQSVVVKNSIDQLNFNDSSITSTTNTSSANPLFTSATDYTLQSVSPAIDSGDNSYITATADLLGHQRIFNTTVDIGAYEFGSPLLGVNKNIVALENFKLYPNPVNSILNIQIEETLEKVEVYTIQGQKILESNNSKSVNVFTLSSGMYLLKVYSQVGKVGVKRFIKE